MKLCYRGVSYDYTPNPSPKMGSTITTGKYRGSVVEFKAMAEIPEQPAHDLTWRGISYRSGNSTPSTTEAIVPVTTPVSVQTANAKPTPTVAAMARNLFIRHHQRNRKREQGMMVRLAAEVGIPVEVAAHYHSQIQGKLPHDFSSYDRSYVSMS